MVIALFRIVNNAKTTIAELAGASLVVAGIAQISIPGGWIAAGVAVLGKAVEWDMKS